MKEKINSINKINTQLRLDNLNLHKELQKDFNKKQLIEIQKLIDKLIYENNELKDVNVKLDERNNELIEELDKLNINDKNNSYGGEAVLWKEEV